MADTTKQATPAASSEASVRIESAARRHKRLFALNVIWLSLAGLFTVWLSWRVWKAGNSEQSAIAKAADERIAIVERKASEAKTAQQRVEIELAEAKKALADSQIKLENIWKAQVPRMIVGPEFGDTLKGKKKCKIVELWYQPNDGEAFNFAVNIFFELTTSGWESPFPVPIPEGASTKQLSARPDALSQMPPAMRVGGQPTGVTLVARKLELARIQKETPDIPMATLSKAFLISGFGGQGGIDVGLPEDTVRIVVGAKP